jgi:hypothetical protein
MKNSHVRRFAVAVVAVLLVIHYQFLLPSAMILNLKMKIQLLFLPQFFARILLIPSGNRQSKIVSYW